ncbi:MAG: hypothetical protein JXR36_05320 [Bacteroidales bacterium]|nr:hypothetical protein [Bacteroidales bacterium]
MENLELMGVQEMDAKEMRNETGGFLWGIPALLGTGLLVAATWEVIMDGSAQCAKDFKKGYQSTQQYKLWKNHIIIRKLFP